MTPTTAGPTSPTERITNLDTVRGIATLGILVMNAVSYGLAEAAYFNLDAAGTETWLDWVIGVAGEVLVDQKAMALFSLLFGAGIVMFADRAEANGRRPVLLSLWRNVLLLAIGLLHSLVWEGDVLTVYAVCSPILLAVRRRSPRALFVAGATTVLASALWAGLTQLAIDGDADELGSFWFVGADAIGDTVGLFLVGDFLLRALGMMLIGVALYRTGVVQGSESATVYRLMAAVGLGVGVPLAVLGVVVQRAGGFSVDVALIGLVPNTVATIPMALGALGLISLWDRRPDTALHRRVRAVGRMALTNYLTQTVIGVIVLRGVFEDGDLTRTSIALFVVLVWLLQLTWSEPWLRRFRFGPVEWVWRMATYRRWQPLRVDR